MEILRDALRSASGVRALTMDFPLYNLFNGLGLIGGILLLERDFKRRGDGRRFPAFLICAVLGYLFGWLCAHFSDFYLHRHAVERVQLTEHATYGYSFFGGLVGATLFFVALLRILRFDLSESIDRIAPLVPLVHGFGRIGCFFGGCCYGKMVSISGWTFRFPVQLLSALLLFGLFWLLFSRRFGINRVYLYAWIYAVIRFGVGFLRGDDRGRLITGVLSPAQEISIGIPMLFTGIYVVRKILSGLRADDRIGRARNVVRRDTYAN